MEIHNLLNPVVDPASEHYATVPSPPSTSRRSHAQSTRTRPCSVSGQCADVASSSSPTRTTTVTAPTTPPSRKHVKLKVVLQDAARRHAPVRYPPFQIRSPTLLAHLRRFGVDTELDIQAAPQFTPYTSHKKDLLEKTGCAGFDTYQYKFQYNESKGGDDFDVKNHAHEHERIVMWDFNTGLVRMTPLFKSQDWSKTTPKKAIEKNEGLMSLCPSVTGGAISAQGYWMPYEAARAMATTFCYNIRYALTPLFGADFPASCTPPGDPAFASFAIDASHVRAAAARMRDLRQSDGSVAMPVTPSPAKRSRDETVSPESDDTTPTPPSKRARFARVAPLACDDAGAEDTDDGYMPRDKYDAVQREIRAGAFTKAELFTSIAVLWEKCGFGDLREYVDVRDVIVVGDAGKRHGG